MQSEGWGGAVTAAADRAYGALRDGILDGRYGFGDKLGEIEVAEELGLSRTPVREALRRLGSEGLIEVLPNRGARVRTWTAQDLEETYELRAVLEGLAARRAGEFGELAALNARFHELIVTAAGSAQLASTLQGLVQLPLVMRTYRRY